METEIKKNLSQEMNELLLYCKQNGLSEKAELLRQMVDDPTYLAKYVAKNLIDIADEIREDRDKLKEEN